LHTLAQSGESLWTHDLEASLLRGEIDLIVHSLKDVPTKVRGGCVVSTVGGREWGGDVVVLRRGLEGDGGGRGLAGLKDGAVVGTSSVRRAAMIRRRYPGLRIKDVRGNVPTRLGKLDDYGTYGFDALVLAGAGMQRLGLGERIEKWLGREEGMLRAVGQGALGVEWREGDGWVARLVAGVRTRRVEWECRAERSLLRTVEGGCSVPVGVETEWLEEEKLGSEEVSDETRREILKDGDGERHPSDSESAKGDGKGRGLLVMRAMVVSLDGQECVEAERTRIVASDEDAEEAGWEMAQELVEKGAGEILEKITLNRGMIQGQDNA